MYATVRRYVGKADFADQLAARKEEVVSLISGVPGFRAYYLIRAGGDTVSVTVCDDEAGAQQSNTVAADWVRENMPEIASSPPEISAGDVVITT
jgi:heme-degrading monooxygenase HmoA